MDAAPIAQKGAGVTWIRKYPIGGVAFYGAGGHHSTAHVVKAAAVRQYRKMPGHTTDLKY